VDLKQMGAAAKAALNPARAAREAAKSNNTSKEATWMPPVLRTVGVTGEGMPELVDALERHFSYLEGSGKLRERRRARLRERVVDAVEQRVRARLWRDVALKEWLEEQLPALERGETTPLTVAKALLDRSAAAGTLTGQDR